MHLRPATRGDFASLCELDTVIARNAERRDEMAAWLDEGTSQLVEIDSRIAAYGVVTRHFFGQAFVAMLMVGSRFRRQGIGLALISHFQAACAGFKLFSSTNLSNLPMHALLAKAGFKPSGDIDNLDENDPEIVFYYGPR